MISPGRAPRPGAHSGRHVRLDRHDPDRARRRQRHRAARLLGLAQARGDPQGRHRVPPGRPEQQQRPAPQRPAGAPGGARAPATGSPSAGTSSCSTACTCYQHDDQGPTSIIADDLTVEVKGAILLDDVSFALRHGTLLGIVGPSGCGKSTLLKAMTGIRPATARQAALRRQGPLRALLGAALPHRHGAPGRRAAPPAHRPPGAALRRVAALRQRRAAQGSARSGSTRCSSCSASPTAASSASTRSPAASASAPRSRWSCSPSRRCWRSTSRPPASTRPWTRRSCGSCGCWPTAAAPSSWSPTACCTSTCATTCW